MTKIKLGQDYSYFNPAVADIQFKVFWMLKLLDDRNWFQLKLKQLIEDQNAHLARLAQT